MLILQLNSYNMIIRSYSVLICELIVFCSHKIATEYTINY